MSNTFKKTSLRGFTLIELLVVIAIIGLLSTAIMGPVQTGLKKGRDTRKISDVSQIQGALLQYAGDNGGQYPIALEALDPTYMVTDPNMLNTSPTRNRFMYTVYADAAGIVVNYHLGTALENQNASLQGDADCGMMQGAAAAAIGTVTTDWSVLVPGTPLAPSFVTVSPVGAPAPVNTNCTLLDAGYLLNTNWSAAGAGNPPTIASSTDFGGAGASEAANGICSANLATCIFDISAK